MDVQEVTLAAGVRTQIDTSGRFFMLIDTSSPLDVGFIKNRSTFRETGRNVEEGYKSFPDPSDPQAASDTFDGVVFTSAVGQTIRYAISQRAGDFAKIGIDVTFAQPSSFDPSPDVATAGVAAVQVLPSNANRRLALIRNVSAANCRLGDATVAAGSGQQLRPGETFTTEVTGPIFMIREGGVDVTVSVLEELA